MTQRQEGSKRYWKNGANRHAQHRVVENLQFVKNAVSVKHSEAKHNKTRYPWRSLVVQQVKDLVLSLQWLRSPLWLRFSPCPGNFYIPRDWPKKTSFFFFFFGFLRQYLWRMEVPRLGIPSELQLPAYATATATGDPSQVYSLHHSSRQCQILNPLRTGIKPTTS